MNHIAVIPARAGSESIIGKNLKVVAGKTLIQHAVDLAQKSKEFSRVILSTDIESAIVDYRNNPHVEIHHRPDPLCTSQALMGDVVEEVINAYHLNNNHFLWLFQPTTPFRTELDIMMIKNLIKEHKANSVISVKHVGADHPSRMYKVRGASMVPLYGKLVNFKNKQDLKDNIYIRNGAFYVVKVGEFIKNRSNVGHNKSYPNEFYIHPTIPYIMDEARSINIDNDFHLKIARSLWR